MRRPVLTLGSLCLSVILLLGGCAQVEVSEDYDSAFHFINNLVFAWNPDHPERAGTILENNDLLADRFKNGIEEYLIRGGFSFGPSPDLFISYTYSVEPRIESEPVTTGMHFGLGTSSLQLDAPPLRLQYQPSHHQGETGQS